MLHFKPNLFVPGAAKSGTTSLHNLLNQHPEICMSSVKEPGYWKNEKFKDFKNIEKEKLDIDVSNFLYCKKVISPSNEEIKKHNGFLKSKFNKNFF